MSEHRPIILCFVAYYLPGYRSGGPVRTISNFVDRLGDEFDIRIVCRDRDALDTCPYPKIEIDAWNPIGKANVFYASSKTLSLLGISRLLRYTEHDVLYLNSFFSFGFTVLPLLVRRLGMAPQTPCVIAPRGEFSQGAIALKALKKRAYIWLVKQLGFYRYLNWQASSQLELADIQRELGDVAETISIAPDLTPAALVSCNEMPERRSGPLRVVFLSRISQMKNLDFLLRVLAGVSVAIEFSIFGPQEDLHYWNQCQELIKRLPSNIKVSIAGQVPQEEVRDVFSQYDLFLFPTRGENFGHVIFESLSAGTPVIVSDQTPWQPDANGGLQTLPLDEDRWVNSIKAWATLDVDMFEKKRRAALNYAKDYMANDQPLQQNQEIFYATLRGKP